MPDFELIFRALNGIRSHTREAVPLEEIIVHVFAHATECHYALF